jgi:CHAD domain-containing protein
VTSLRHWIEQLEPATEITRKALQPAELVVIDVLNKFNREFEAIDLHHGFCGKTPKEIHQVKTALRKAYDLLGAILPYLEHDKSEAA